MFKCFLLAFVCFLRVNAEFSIIFKRFEVSGGRDMYGYDIYFEALPEGFEEIDIYYQLNLAEIGIFDEFELSIVEPRIVNNSTDEYEADYAEEESSMYWPEGAEKIATN